jgi:hypothetical protein
MVFVFLRTKLPFALILFTLSADLVSLSPPFPLIWLTFSIDIVSVCLPLSADRFHLPGNAAHRDKVF